MNDNNLVNELEKYKSKVRRIVEEKGMYSIMNSTKWRELKKGIAELPFVPQFVIKAVDEEESDNHRFEDNMFSGFDWGLYLDNYLGGDIYAVPFFAVEWVKVRPRINEKQGRLMPDKILDESEEFLVILKQNNIPYEEKGGDYIIYGYKK